MAQKINITTLPTEERILYFQKAAEIENKSVHIIEKDYWVCWLLEKLFSIKDVNEHPTFKGGRDPRSGLLFFGESKAHSPRQGLYLFSKFLFQGILFFGPCHLLQVLTFESLPSKKEIHFSIHQAEC